MPAIIIRGYIFTFATVLLTFMRRWSFLELFLLPGNRADVRALLLRGCSATGSSLSCITIAFDTRLNFHYPCPPVLNLPLAREARIPRMHRAEKTTKATFTLERNWG